MAKVGQTYKLERARFDLHVALIMDGNKENKTAAVFRAYCEGAEGLRARLAPPAIPVFVDLENPGADIDVPAPPAGASK